MAWAGETLYNGLTSVLERILGVLADAALQGRAGEIFYNGLAC